MSPVQEGSFNFNDSSYVIQPVDDRTSKQTYEHGVPHRVKKVEMPKGNNDKMESQ